MSLPVTLADAERAAVMIMLLDEEQAAAILSELGPEELRILGEKMCALGEIGPAQIADAVGGFVRTTESSGMRSGDRPTQVRSLLTRAVGEVKGESLMERIMPQDGPARPALDLARWLTPRALIPLVKDEHPQAVAVLLVQLDAEVAAAVLHALPPALQPQVLHRIATLGPVSPDAITMLENVLEARISAQHGPAMLTMGGPREAADIINNAGKAAEKRLMPELGKIDKAMARQVESEMFKFEHLFALDTQQMGALLREIENEVLIDALKGTAEENRAPFFAAMSSRAADGVRDEIEGRGRIKMAEVLEAQKAVVAIARRLAADGTIVVGPGGGDDDYV